MTKLKTFIISGVSICAITTIWLFMPNAAETVTSKTESAIKAECKDCGTTKIAVLDAGAVIQKSAAFKDIQKQMEKRKDTYMQEAKTLEDKLSKKYKDLEGKKNVLAQDAYDKQSKDLAQEAEEYNKNMYMEKSKFDKAFSESVAKIEEKASDIVKKQVELKGYTMVMNRMSLVYVDDKLDITEEVLKELDKQLATVKVTFDEKKEDKKEDKK